LIEVKALSKNYGKVKAVMDISFSVGAEQVVGFLGPNGAGKTTVMKILTGFHFPTEGIVLIDGIPVDEDPVEVKKRIGYLPENVPLYGDLTVDEYLVFCADVRDMPREERAPAIEASLERCGLKEFRSRKIETLSKGYRQRTGLAQAILHDPPILILDEPTNGLDPNQIIEIRSLIRDLGKKKTVILSTHILQEVEAICSQVLIINEGRIAAQGTADEIAASVKGGDTWELALKGADEGGIRNTLSRMGAGINVGSVESAEGGLLNVSFFIPNGASPEMSSGEGIFDWAISEGIKILGMNRRKLSIEDIFVKLTGAEQ
jgi:ABC-2 type transport system ATP-binding protein